jgi:hypothetical protein
MNKLKIKTSYIFSQEDKEFAMELAKVGSVHFLSTQVSLESCKRTDNIDFKEWNAEGSLGLKMPDNWVIQWVGYHDGRVSITFGISKK